MNVEYRYRFFLAASNYKRIILLFAPALEEAISSYMEKVMKDGSSVWQCTVCSRAHRYGDGSVVVE
jgi:hypothetical protein